MTLTQQQKERFYDWQDNVADALTVADFEASTWQLISQWSDQWGEYIKSGAAPGSDRPPNKPPHP